MDAALERLVALVRRDLGAEDVRVVDAAPASSPNTLVARLADGRHLVASFVEAPADHDALARRLEMLGATFASALGHAETGHLRLSPATSLFEELRALAQRAQAIDALVVDAHSPIVWGSAIVRPRARVAPPAETSHQKLIDVPEWATEPGDPYFDGGQDRGSGPSLETPAEDARLLVLSNAVADRVRDLATHAEVHKGRHFRHAESGEGEGHFSVSFAGIYVLVLVYEGVFDELRAERATHEALPRVERLVAALPPLDPEPQPMGGVVAFRRQRK